MRRDDRRWPLTSLGSYVPLNIPGKLVRVLYEIVLGDLFFVSFTSRKKYFIFTIEAHTQVYP